MTQLDKLFERESGPWPFSNGVTESICLHAGREASAALFVAIGPWANGGIVARKAVYCEPFTYWDWHGVHPDERFARTRGSKRQQTWERQRGFRQGSHNVEFGYPSPRARWQAFKTSIAMHPQRCLWVQRIAVAHWMNADDMDWIADHLTKLKGLDLSDILVKRMGSDKGASPSGLKGVSLLNEKLTSFLARLTWLGLPDVRVPGLDHTETLPLAQYLSMCTELQTLCIRDTRGGNMRPYSFQSAKAASDWITNTIAGIPATTTALELQLCLPSIDRLVAELVKRKSKITQVGIDLGAWAQTYLPITEQLRHEEIQKSTSAAAHKATLDAYEEEHNKVFSGGSKWWLPNSLSMEEGRTKHEYQVDRPAFARNLYQIQHITGVDGGGALASNSQIASSGNSRKKSTSTKHGLDRLNFSSMYENLFKLYRAGTSNGHGNVQFYTLTPEWQVDSTDPIHPLAMIRPESGGKAISTGQLMNLYDWLNKTFDWRPVFDWDYFMKLDSPDRQDAQIKQIAQQLQHMRDAYIPIRILIGRRHWDVSSLYWGGDSAAWAQTLDQPVNTSLEQIAPLVDSLIVHYDLRNPLDHDRLEEIDMKEPYIGPSAVCPRIPCPWKHKNCPFEKQWDQRPIAQHSQPAINEKAATASKRAPLLASRDISCLPTGEDASLHPADDFDPAKVQGQPTLHHLARHAAYLREAASWQQFWSKYSPLLTNLSELRVRMSRSFDKVGTLRLRMLLDPRDGWKMHTFAEERQHMQTREDSKWSVGKNNAALTHLPEDKIWPGGRFVRRLWVRMDAPPTFEVPHLERSTEDVTRPETRADNSVFDNLSEDDIERIEREELERAIKAAKIAGQREEEYQKRLEAVAEITTPMPNAEDTETANKSTVEATTPLGLSAEERRNRTTARQTWVVEMQDQAQNLSEQKIETVIQQDLHRSSNDLKTIASDAVQIREVLGSTRAELERLIPLCPENVVELGDALLPLEDLVKELAEKRARPMAKQLLEQEARTAAAQAKMKAEAEAQIAAAAVVTSPPRKPSSDIFVSGDSEAQQHVRREIPDTLPLPDDYVYEDPSGDGFIPKQLLGLSQPHGRLSQTLDNSDMESLLGEAPASASHVELPTPPLGTPVQTAGGDSPVDVGDDDFWDDANVTARDGVSKFPDEIPETIDVDRFDDNPQTTALSVSGLGLGNSILGKAHVQSDIEAAPMIEGRVTDVTTIEETIVVEEDTSSQQEVTEHTTQDTKNVSTRETVDAEDIINTTKVLESPEIPETPGVTETQFDDPIPLPTPIIAPKQPPQPVQTQSAQDLRPTVPSYDNGPTKPSKKRTRTTRSSTPTVGSRHSTRSVTPVSYVEVESGEDEERPRKKRQIGKRGVKDGEWAPVKKTVGKKRGKKGE
ncbi:hypothetical protein T440DRAFT_521760 [Plenodomus tracheiphilus IPT5]|uniref:Uncharacterized protein n=1 Tax=Plenodomus tracheiphilus IPT5 TaxID=1408161 RepID=A0A6A7ASU6_9PLEO|nr:hypothetical protein T440DRAFT_521760 [Plenodomus tracheiphilus IPT5]